MTRKKQLIILFLLISAISGIIALSYIHKEPETRNIPETTSGPLPSAEISLTFDRYPAEGLFNGKPVPPDFASYPPAKNFRTVITNAEKNGPNFAGFYTLAEWGCGTSCQMHAIIDVRTGKIVAYNIPSAYGTSFRLNSRLLILNPSSALERMPDIYLNGIRTEYYELKGDKLVSLN